MAEQELLTYEVSQFARTLARASAVSVVLTDLAERATTVLGVAGAGVSALESGQLGFVTATDERCADLERAQAAEQAGPGVDACRNGMIVAVADLTATSHDWGRYRQTAQDAGIAAVAAVPLCQDGECIGAVGLYDIARRDWHPDDLAAVGILADMATGYLVHVRELDRQRRLNEQLREALDSRIVIEQAKGVLAAERHTTVDQAFEVLRRHARNHSVTLRSVAEAVVSLGLRP